jgi:hypothetical protein
MEWEYMRSSMIQTWAIPKNEDGSIDDIHLWKWNALGRKGWELVSVFREKSETIGYFNRVKPTDAEV